MYFEQVIFPYGLQSCRDYSGGPKCDRCAEGFYGDPNNIVGCQSCPCPETSKNFARGCTFQSNRVSCICRPGYTGDLCDRCSSGYFGVPDTDGGYCTECDCDPNGIASTECDGLSGQCHCKPNITGRRCDKCTEPRHILEDGACKGKAIIIPAPVVDHHNFFPSIIQFATIAR